MVGHELPDGHSVGGGSPRFDAIDRGDLPGRGVVDRFVESAGAKLPFRGEPLEVAAGRLWFQHERHGAGIGCDHQITGEPTLESQSGHAEGAVLVAHLLIACIVSRLRDAPGHSPPPAIGDVAADGGPAGSIEQGVFVGGHYQQRHQVLKHRTAPGEERRSAAGGGEQPSQGKPVGLFQLLLRDQNKTDQTGLRCQQIIEARVGAVLRHIEADGEQPPLGVIEKPEIDVRQCAACPGQPDQRVVPCGSVVCGGLSRSLQPVEPLLRRGDLLGRSAACRSGSRDQRKERGRQVANGAQSGVGVEIGESRAEPACRRIHAWRRLQPEMFWRERKRRPDCQVMQILQMCRRIGFDG